MEVDSYVLQYISAYVCGQVRMCMHALAPQSTPSELAGDVVSVHLRTYLTPSFSHLMSGGGSPLAEHCTTAVSPSDWTLVKE